MVDRTEGNLAQTRDLILATANDHSEPGRPLPEVVLARACWTYGVDLSHARICRSNLGAALLRSVNVPAIAVGSRIYLDPAMQPQSPHDEAALLLHELAHVAQGQGVSPIRLLSDGPLDSTEREADQAAEAALRGERYPILPRGNVPIAQPAWPLLILIALAAIAGGAATIYGVREREAARGRRASISDEERERVRQEILNPHIHETWWGLIPFVGSVDQVLNGDNAWIQVGGAVFFVLDLTLVAGIGARLVARGSAQAAIQGTARASAEGATQGYIVFEARQGVRQGLQQVLRGGGDETQRAALRVIEEALSEGAEGGLVMTSEQALSRVIPQHGTVLVVGTQTTERVLGHSVTYLIHNGQVYKLHGSVLQAAQRSGAFQVVQEGSQYLLRSEGAEAGGRTLQQFVQSFDSMSIYTGAELARAGNTAEGLINLTTFWQSRSQGLRAITNVLNAQGCGRSQAFLMRQMGIPSGGASWIPLFVEQSRMGASAVRGVGQHFVLNPQNLRRGAALQLVLMSGGIAVGAGGTATMRALPIVQSQQSREAILVEPVGGVAFSSRQGIDAVSSAFSVDMSPAVRMCIDPSMR